MTSKKQGVEIANVTDDKSFKDQRPAIEYKSSREDQKSAKDGKKDVGQDLVELPPSGVSLHKRRRGEPPASLAVKPSGLEIEGSSSCSIGPEDCWSNDGEAVIDPEEFCKSMIQRLKERDDLASTRGKELASRTKETFEALDTLENMLELVNQLVNLHEKNASLKRRLRDVNSMKRVCDMYKKIDAENERLYNEKKDLEVLNEAMDSCLEIEYGQSIFDSILAGGRVKRSGSKWKGHAKSLLRKERARSAGGDDSDALPGTPNRRRSEGIFAREVEKSKVSNWTRVKSAFRWEKATGQWPPSSSAGAVAAGAMVGAVALAGSAPSHPTTPITPSQFITPEIKDSASLTPGSAISLTPTSSCEELRMDTGNRRKSMGLRCDENFNTFLNAPTQDDSSTSPSPNKMHKTPWGKMRDIIQTRRESVRKKTTSRGSKVSPDLMPGRRRSFSDGGDSDAPPALTLTIPSSEELESEPSHHHALRKQRSLELGSRPPQTRPPRASKWTKVKRAFLTSASASMPSSPNRNSAFFGDADNEGVSSGCEASAVREEIRRDYVALQSKLGREISDRRGKLYSSKGPVATEEQLSADFRKKLAEWQRIKGGKQPPPVPARQDLSEDFLKKWDDWNSMKDNNSVPTWEKVAKPDEVLVQTSTGLFKFQGISRSFTRKLHEWEKSRGIAPEASTSALLRAAKERSKAPTMPLTRTQSDGSVAPSAGSGRMHASSLSVNDVEDFDSEYDPEHSPTMEGDCLDSPAPRGAVLVEVEAEEICTAAPLMAVTPRHAEQRPVYTYGEAEPRLLCETTATITGTAVVQHNNAVIISETRSNKPKEQTVVKMKTSREQPKSSDKGKRKISRQPSIEEDAKFIRKTIEEIERGSSSRLKENEEHETFRRSLEDDPIPSTSSKGLYTQYEHNKPMEMTDEEKPKEFEKSNGKKKSKSRARLEREQSKPSESDTEQDVETVTVEIPRRRKKPRKLTERPKTPPMHTDSEQEIYVLKFKAPEHREGSPEVIVKTTRKIFSPVVRIGESVPRAVIPVDVEDLTQSAGDVVRHNSNYKLQKQGRREMYSRSKSSGDLQTDDPRRCRPPLPLSPSSQRKPQPKETAPSIRIMVQRYNMKIEEGHTSGASSGASSPAWRSPAVERRRPSDMPVGVNIRNNPFLEREVIKSASACQLSRRDQTSCEKPLTPTPDTCREVCKSHSTNALHPKQTKEATYSLANNEDSQETIKLNTASTDTIVPDLTKNLPVFQKETKPPVSRQCSDTAVPSVSRYVAENPFFERSLSTVEYGHSGLENEAAKLSERSAKIKAAREKFLSSVSMRREGTSSAHDLRPENRLSQISCDSDLTENTNSGTQETGLGRSASTGMVNVDQDAWQRVTHGGRRNQSRSKFSLSKLTAKFRRKDESAVSRLCRQSLLVQLRKQ